MNLFEIENFIQTDNFEAISLEFKPFIINFSLKFNLLGYDLEDIQQECYYALMLAITKYEKSKNRFVAFATSSIKHHIFNLLRSQEQERKYREIIYLEEQLRLFNFEVDYVEQIEQKQIRLILKDAFMQLTVSETLLVQHLYYKKATLTQYSKLHNIPYSLARSKKIQVLNKLRENIIFSEKKI